MTPEQEAFRGEQAKRIIEDPLYVESYQIVKDHLLRKMLMTGLQDTAEREQIFLQINLLDKLRSTLEYAMQSGKVAVYKLEVEKRKKNAR